MFRPTGLIGASVALLLALPSTAVAQVADRSVVFTSDPSQALVIDRDAGLQPLIKAASDVLPLAVAGLAVAEARFQGMARLLAEALKPPAPPRRRTRPGRSAVAKRLQSKKLQALKKIRRSRPAPE